MVQIAHLDAHRIHRNIGHQKKKFFLCHDLADLADLAVTNADVSQENSRTSGDVYSLGRLGSRLRTPGSGAGQSARRGGRTGTSGDGQTYIGKKQKQHNL